MSTVTNLNVPGVYSDQGQNITTQFPADIVARRIALLVVFPLWLCAIAKRRHNIVRSFATLGITVAAYVAYKHLLINDPLVEAFYKIAGGKTSYENLPTLQWDASKTTYENLKIPVVRLTHNIYRFTTADGRKGMLFKKHNHSTFVKHVLVEKFGPYDMPRRRLNVAPWFSSISIAVTLIIWQNSLSHYEVCDDGSLLDIAACISATQANELISNRNHVLGGLQDPRFPNEGHSHHRSRQD